jgi:hypothetical protein
VQLQGKLLNRTEDEILLFVPTITRQIGFHFETMSQRVSIDRGEILALEQRRLDAGKTGGLLVVIGAAAGVAAVEILSGRSGASGMPPLGDGGPSDHRQGPQGMTVVSLIQLPTR